MRLPLGKHALVSLTVLGVLVTSVVAVGLMDPTLVPGMARDETDPAAGSQSQGTLPAQRGTTPAVVTVVTPAQNLPRTAQPASGDRSQTTRQSLLDRPGTQASALDPAEQQEQVLTRPTPTPNPNFTPDVNQQPAGGDHEEEYEADDDGHDDERDDEHEDEEAHDDDDGEAGDDD